MNVAVPGSPTSLLRGPFGQTAIPWLLAVVVYAALALWASQFMLEDPAVPMIWPATGVALAFLFRFGYGLALPIVLVGFAVQVLLGVAPLQALVLAFAAVVAGIIGVWLLQQLGVRRDLGRVRDVLLVLAVGLGASAVFSGCVGTLTAVGLSPTFPETFGLCWLADSMGVLLFAPLLLTLTIRPPSSETLGRLPVLLLPPLAAYASYALELDPTLALPLSYLVFPLVMWVAFRHGTAAVSLSVALVTVVAIGCTAAGKGPFAQAGMQPDLISLHLQLGLLQITGLLLAAVRNEAAEAQERERMHVRTLARIGRMNAMSAMAAGLAHEINQPLCAVSSYAQTARRMLDRGTDPRALSATLERITDGTERASEIVRRTRRFLQAGDGRRAVVDLREVIRESVELMRPEFRRSRTRLELDLPGSALPVRVDPVELQQVFVNLFQNAEEVMLESERRPEDRWLRVSLAPAGQGGDRVQVSVLDNGPGLPAGSASQLFEPLVSHRQGGTGLGLAISRSIIEAHGGTLTASNSPGAGAVFRATLPLAKEAGDGHAR